MPRLPGAEELGVRQYQDRSSVITPTADFSGQKALISTVKNISDRRNERLDRSSLHKAKMHFQKSKLEADSAFDQDPDFETYQERYDKKIADAMTQSAGMIRNPNDRSMFEESMSLYRAQGNQQIIAKAWNKEVDKGLSDLDETLTIGRENYLRASNASDKQFAIDTANEAINAAEEATHIDADKATNMRQGLAVDLAIASVEVAPPEKQIELLKSDKGMMQYIPLDTRNKMLKSAEVQYSATQAMESANAIREGGGTLQERMDQVNKIKDPKVKSATKAQVKDDYNLEKTAEGEARYQTYDGMAKGIIAGGNLNEMRAEKPSEWAA
jgi:hypothetical protein